jgi:hypothetical protein
MRQAWILTWRPHQALRAILAGLLAFTACGCYPQYYYYGDPACTPAASAPRAVQAGQVCDVPTQVVEGGTKVASISTRTTIVSGATPSNSPRVVVSQPSEPSKFSWRRTDLDGSLATTSVQGGVSDSSVNR